MKTNIEISSQNSEVILGISELPLNILEFSQQGNQPIINIPLPTGGFLRHLRRDGEEGLQSLLIKDQFITKENLLSALGPPQGFSACCYDCLLKPSCLCCKISHRSTPEGKETSSKAVLQGLQVTLGPCGNPVSNTLNFLSAELQGESGTIWVGCERRAL